MIFDAVFPVLNAIDGRLAVLVPDLVRIVIWGLTCGAAAMGIYGLVSNQKAISGLKAETRELRRRLLDSDLEFKTFRQLAGRNVILSLKLVCRTFFPALLAAIPTLTVVFWLDAHHAREYPPGGGALAVKKIYLEGLPGWAAGWELPFFLAVAVTALGLKLALRIK